MFYYRNNKPRISSSKVHSFNLQILVLHFQNPKGSLVIDIPFRGIHGCLTWCYELKVCDNGPSFVSMALSLVNLNFGPQYVPV